MSRELWSQAGEPTWAIDERLRRLEVRVERLAEVVAELVRHRPDATNPAPAELVRHRPDATNPAPAELVRHRPDATDPAPAGPVGRAAGVGRPCRCHQVVSDGSGRGGGAS